MRVAVDVSPLSHVRTGVGTFLLGMIRGLLENGVEVVAFTPASVRYRPQIESALASMDVQKRLPLIPLAHRWRTLWSRLQWPPAERWLGRFDVLHFSDWMYPPQHAGARATTVHDLVPLHHPEWTHGRTVRMHTAKYLHAARRADPIVCISEYTARDVQRTLGVEAERTCVAYPAPADVFRAEGERADLGRPYVLTVATLEPRKNLETLLDAHESLADEVALAIVGAAGWGPQPRVDRPGVIRLGYVDDEQLARLYRGAEAFAYPSRFEGFGIPLLEAMASGTPVVASSHPSLDEAAGEAALRADPESPEAWATAIREASAQRESLVRLGRDHAGRFTTGALGVSVVRAYEHALAKISA
jgi:glycosyltransferase involved in cell wall biosynthesis